MLRFNIQGTVGTQKMETKILTNGIAAHQQDETFCLIGCIFSYYWHLSGLNSNNKYNGKGISFTNISAILHYHGSLSQLV